jgi:hypothetical protein
MSEGGQITVAGDSSIRRTGNLSMKLHEQLHKNQEDILWMDHRIRIYIGLEDFTQDNQRFVFFLIGTFQTLSETATISPDRTVVQITFQDMMSFLSRQTLAAELTIDAGTPVTSAIQAVLELHGEFNHHIMPSIDRVPFDLEFAIGTNVVAVLERLRDLFKDNLHYYDRDAYYIFRRYDIQVPDGVPVSWIFQGEYDLRTGYSFPSNFEAIRNQVTVWGGADQFGAYPSATAKITNEQSAFHPDGRMGLRPHHIVDNALRTQLQCDARARFELFNMSHRQETTSFGCFPIYSLDGNQVIRVPHVVTGELEWYEITSVTVPLQADAEMQVQARKLYFHHMDIRSEFQDHLLWIARMRTGIMQHGWIHQTETLVQTGYDFAPAPNAELMISFEVHEETERVITHQNWAHSRAQSIVLNLHEFRDVTSPIGRGTHSISASRKVAYGVCLSALSNHWGASKFRNVPVWFRMGLAHMLTGADELVATILHRPDGLNQLATRAIQLFAGGIAGIVQDRLVLDHAASYVLTKWISRRITTNLSTMITEIDDSTLAAHLILDTVINNNTADSNIQATRAAFSSGAVQFIQSLPIQLTGPQNDTGSIFGNQEGGGVALTDATVMTRIPAIPNLGSNWFDLEIRDSRR